MIGLASILTPITKAKADQTFLCFLADFGDRVFSLGGSAARTCPWTAGSLATGASVVAGKWSVGRGGPSNCGGTSNCVGGVGASWSGVGAGRCDALTDSFGRTAR